MITGSTGLGFEVMWGGGAWLLEEKLLLIKGHCFAGN